MNFRSFSLVFTLFFSCYLIHAQKYTQGKNVVAISQELNEQEIVKLAASVGPSARQLKWQQLETTAFIHFGVNTFYNQEWGGGTEDPNRFNPTELNTDQWAKVIKEAGFKMLIMTCKHHDGFCLWPSTYSNHSVASSLWRNGKGDVVKDVSESCRKYGLKFGIYLSPWDRHEASYGKGTEYDIFFMNQLTELLSNYGTVDEVWFDGACGEGSNGKKQVYDWKAYYALIRKIQPQAVIAIMGPDVRWVGTESGYGRETEWSVVPYNLTNQQSIADNSQQTISNEGFVPSGDQTDANLGSREKISKANALIWYPSEVDVSIRPGWFWHASENERVKTAENLLDIYFSSVGRNSQLLLNIPPDTTGLINEADVKILKEWKQALDHIFSNNLIKNASLVSKTKTIPSVKLTDKLLQTSIKPLTSDTGCFEINLSSVKTFDILVLQENIINGQKVERFEVEAFVDNKWEKITEATTIGYKRILRFPNVTTQRLKIRIKESRGVVEFSEIGIYQNLPNVKAEPEAAAFTDELMVTLKSNEPNAQIHFTTNGSIPDKNSTLYTKPLQISNTTELHMVAIRKNGTRSFVRKASYNKAKYGISLNTAPDSKYKANGAMTLVDGKTGSTNYDDGNWIGMQGKDLIATIDLGEAKNVSDFAVQFNENTKSWIFRPQKVEFEFSDDGITFIPIFRMTYERLDADNEQIIKLSFHYPCFARYIRVYAFNYGPLPDFHSAKGEPSWLFIDEISVN